MSLVAVLSPSSSNMVNAQAVQFASVAASISSQWLYTDVVQLLTATIDHQAGRILCAMFLATPGPVSMLSGLSLLGSAVWSLVSGDGPGWITVEITGSIFAVICSVLSQQQLQSEAQAIVAAMTSASTEATAHDLLGIMCDAVVALDDQLLVAPCPKLDALLLRSASVPAGNEGPFLSLFQVTDRDRVSQFLAGGDGGAQSLHATLRDVHGSRLGVQLFHKRFEDVFGQTPTRDRHRGRT